MHSSRSTAILSAAAANLVPQPGDDEVTAQLRLLGALQAATSALLDEFDDAHLEALTATVLLKLGEDLSRNALRAKVRAAGAMDRHDAHRLRAEALESLSTLHGAQLADGLPLPDARPIASTAKPRFRGPVELISSLCDITDHEAKTLVRGHRQLVGDSDHPASFGELGQRFATPEAHNPATLLKAAAKLERLQLQPTARRAAEEKVAQTLPRGQGAVNSQLKAIAQDLSRPNLPEREAVHERCAGLRYRGLGPYGHVWELTCTTIDHEFLCTLADRLVNPALTANREGGCSSGATDPFNDLSGADERDRDPAAERARRLLRTVMHIVRRRFSSEAPSDDTAPTASADPAALASTDGTVKPELPLPGMIDLIVTIDYDALRARTDQAGLTAHGQRISATELRRSAAIGGIIPMILGSKGEVLDMDRRRRLFTKAQTRAVVARDGGCIRPGCTMPAHRCEVNHRTPWIEGGQTNVSNATLNCKGDHTGYHAGHYRIRYFDGIPYVLESPERDPEQHWRRNWVWHPNAPSYPASEYPPEDTDLPAFTDEDAPPDEEPPF